MIFRSFPYRCIKNPTRMSGGSMGAYSNITIRTDLNAKLIEDLAPNALIKTTNISTPSYSNSDDFIAKNYGEDFQPNHARPDTLPADATDIKGVDSTTYKYFQKRQMMNRIPILVSNDFFSLKFIPYRHFLSLSRKSNVAYTFTNKGGYKLNDKGLEKALSSYKGKYRNLTFFQENLLPLNTAIGRTKYRKLVKRCLFSALRQYVINEKDVKKVSGIFFFRFTIVPFTEDQKKKIQTDLNKAVQSLLNDEGSRRVLHAACKDHNKQFNRGEQLLKQLRYYNTLGAKNVPGYFARFPFIHQKRLLL